MLDLGAKCVGLRWVVFGFGIKLVWIGIGLGVWCAALGSFSLQESGSHKPYKLERIHQSTGGHEAKQFFAVRVGGVVSQNQDPREGLEKTSADRR